jgi:hypothetical protein
VEALGLVAVKPEPLEPVPTAANDLATFKAILANTPIPALESMVTATLTHQQDIEKRSYVHEPINQGSIKAAIRTFSNDKRF